MSLKTKREVFWLEFTYSHGKTYTCTGGERLTKNARERSMRGGAEWSGPTSRTRDQTGVGQLLVSQEAVRPSPDSRSWSGTVDEWLPRRRTARGRPEAGGRLAGCGHGRAGGQAGAVRGLSWDTILAAVDLTTCLFPANPQSTVIDSFHAALRSHGLYGMESMQRAAAHRCSQGTAFLTRARCS